MPSGLLFRQSGSFQNADPEGGYVYACDVTELVPVRVLFEVNPRLLKLFIYQW